MISSILLVVIGFVGGVLFAKWKEFQAYWKMAKQATEVTKNFKQLQKELAKGYGKQEKDQHEGETIEVNKTK